MPAIVTGESLRSRDVELENWQARRERINRHLLRYRTLSEQMQRRGYETLGFTTNPWTQGTAFRTGFDTYVEVDGEWLMSRKSGDRMIPVADTMMNLSDLLKHPDWENKRDWFVKWSSMFENLLQEIKESPSPVFVWIFLLDAHEPYLSVRDYREENSAVTMYYSAWKQHKFDPVEDRPSSRTRMRLRRAYRDAVRSVDGFIEELSTNVETQDSMVVLHSDHGEAFGEHGTYGHQPRLYEENIHVPFLVYNAGQTGRISDPMSLQALPDVLGELVESPERFDPSNHTSDYVISTTERGRRSAVRGRRWKYILGPEGEELFDLSVDSSERDDVSEEYPKIANWLRRLLRRRGAHDTERDAIAAATADIEPNL